MLVPMEIRGKIADAPDKIDAVVARVKELQRAHPEFYIGSFGESTKKDSQGRLLRRSEEGRALLSAADARHPALGVRRARRGRHPAPARPDGCLRSDGARGHHQPGASDGPVGAGDHPSDRACRGRRLHDVLLEAGTRRARGGPHRRGRPRSRSGYLRALRPHLGADRSRRHGGHVLHRRPDLRLLRPRGHDGGCGRDARVAHGPACPALEAGRQRRPPPRTAHPSASPEGRRGPDLGSDHRSRPSAPGRVGRACGRAARGLSHCRPTS